MTPNKLADHSVIRILNALVLAAVLSSAGLSTRLELRAADGVGDKVGAAASDAEKQITETTKAAESKLQELWKRIDEQRLKNRTPDQLVAWIIMGLLAGGLVHQFSKLNRFATLLIGLAGAFVGGMAANLSQFDLGLGPVLIRYEDLIASMVGAVILVLLARWLASRKSKAAQGK